MCLIELHPFFLLCSKLLSNFFTNILCDFTYTIGGKCFSRKLSSKNVLRPHGAMWVQDQMTALLWGWETFYWLISHSFNFNHINVIMYASCTCKVKKIVLSLKLTRNWQSMRRFLTRSRLHKEVGLIVSSLLYKYNDLLGIINSVDCFSKNLKLIPIMLHYCRSGAGWILQKPFFPWNYCWSARAP